MQYTMDELYSVNFFQWCRNMKTTPEAFLRGLKRQVEMLEKSKADLAQKIRDIPGDIHEAKEEIALFKAVGKKLDAKRLRLREVQNKCIAS